MLTFQPPFQGSQTAVIRKAETRLLVCGQTEAMMAIFDRAANLVERIAKSHSMC